MKHVHVTTQMCFGVLVFQCLVFHSKMFYFQSFFIFAGKKLAHISYDLNYKYMYMESFKTTHIHDNLITKLPIVKSYNFYTDFPAT